jgi:hypothetical protein
MKKSYSFSNIKFSELTKIVNLEKTTNATKFVEWFSLPYNISEAETIFLQELVDKHKDYLSSYSEEDLKMKFISVILNKISFATKRINDFYNASLRAEVNGVELNGFADYMVATGVKEPEKPYFFIQEYKPTQFDKDVEDQLFAELLSGIAINETNIMRGCYVIGRNWYFVIMEKDENNNYTAYISEQFDSLKIVDLKQIYKNLQIVKLHYCQ